MKRIALGAFALVILASATACCGAFQSKEDKYNKEMECALRVTDEKSIEILQRGMFCCEKMPAEVKTLPGARRFYLLRAMALDPKSADPVLQVARSYWDDHDYKQALDYFARAKDMSPKPLTAVIGEITMLRLTKDWAQANGLVKWVREQKAIDSQKVGDYLEARILYDQGKYAEARFLFESALTHSGSDGDALGDTPYTMKDAHLYLAQIKFKSGDTQGAYEEFKLFLQKMSNPDFQLFYKYWVEKLGNDQKALYDKIESDWASWRQ